MKCTNSYHILTTLFLLAVGAFFGYVFGLKAYNALPDQPYEIDLVKNTHLEEYLSAEGNFTMGYPEGSVVTEENGLVTIYPEPTDDIPTPLPYMTVRISEGNVDFATWENLEFEYFEQVVNSFQFRN